MQDNPRILRRERRGVAQHADGIGGPVERAVRLAEAVEAFDVIRAKRDGDLQIQCSQGRLRLLVIQSAPSGVRGRILWVELQRFGQVSNRLFHIDGAAGLPELVVADDVLGMSAYESLEPGDALFQFAL